jgi:hypothetical protein
MLLSEELEMCLIPIHTTKADGRPEILLHPFLISTVDGGEWLASHCNHFTPGEKACCTYSAGHY